ncbi:MAG: hypothetical protein WCZ08_04290 [Parcubacteria group bacterium]|jgi:Tfp pilus assembly protein PilV|nr:hypothetical protein [Candidatus Moranbacteria bacterium]
MIFDKNKKKKKGKKSGFSIGEVMLAVFILGITLTALISLYVTGINELIDERDSVVASLLAQEGVELMRNVRDNNWVDTSNPGSFDGIERSSDSNGCAIDLDDSSCTGSAAIYDLYYSLSSNFYVHDNSESPTEFKRKIIILEPSADERQIISIVTWNNESLTGFDGFNYKDNCTTANKCVFSEAVLTRWGE